MIDKSAGRVIVQEIVITRWFYLANGSDLVIHDEINGKHYKLKLLDVYVPFVVSPLYKGFCAYFLIPIHVYIRA